MPANLRYNVGTWRSMNPDCVVMVHDDKSVQTLMQQHDLPESLAIYRRSSLMAQKKDIASFVVVYIYGGLFLDADHQANKPIAPFLDAHHLIGIAYVGDEGLRSDEELPSVCVFGAAPKHPVLHDVVHGMPPAVANLKDPAKEGGIQRITNVWADIYTAWQRRALATPLQFFLFPATLFGASCANRFGNCLHKHDAGYGFLTTQQGSWHDPLAGAYHKSVNSMRRNRRTIRFIVLALVTVMLVAIFALSCVLIAQSNR